MKEPVAIRCVPLTPHNTAALDQARALMREYAAFLGPGHLCAADFEQELANLPGQYAPPGGVLLLASVPDQPPLGCIALRELPLPHFVAASELNRRPVAGEIKRLWVQPQARGHSAGALLLAAVIDHARAIGYRDLFLDTMPSLMASAVVLYRRFGFIDCPAYNKTADPLVRHMHLQLAGNGN